MRLNTIKIQNFRKLNDVEVKFGEATFLIGANNSGKSSTLDAIEDEFGYAAPSSDKPFKTYHHVKGWKTWEDVPVNWRIKMKIVFYEYSEQL